MVRTASKSKRFAKAKDLMQEPLVHFVCIGLLLFVVYNTLHPQSRVERNVDRIELKEDDIRQLATIWSAKWQRAPTERELHALVEEHLQEEILYREALALGLDQDDTIIKRRLAQKMEFLAEDLSNLPEPGMDELKAWYADNAGRFALPARLSFEHLYFSPDLRGNHANNDAVEALGELTAQSSAPVLADTFMFEKYYADRSADQVASVFGTGFAQAISNVPPGTWQGPIESGLGWHLVRVRSATPGRVPALAEIEGQVRLGWVADQRESAKQKTFAALRARYEIVVPVVRASNAMANYEPPANGDVQ